MSQWMKLSIAVLAGIVIVTTKGQVFVEVGKGLQNLVVAFTGGHP